MLLVSLYSYHLNCSFKHEKVREVEFLIVLIQKSRVALKICSWILVTPDSNLQKYAGVVGGSRKSFRTKDDWAFSAVSS